MIKKIQLKHVLICIVLFLSFILLPYFNKPSIGSKNTADFQTNSTQDNLLVHFLDIGQADCIFIQDPGGQTALIDAGNETDSRYIQSYLMNLGVTKIDVLIETHPHEDHIGSMDDIVYTFDIGTIYAPKVVHESKSNADLKEAIDRKGYHFTYAKAGDGFKLGNTKFNFVSPLKSEYNDLNYYSLVTKLEFGDRSFLFMGDAEGSILNEIMDSGVDLKSDVIKIGHHGSMVSTPINFLQAVSPKIAVITSRSNSLSYPHFFTKTNLNSRDVETHITGGNGTVVISTDGKKISVARSVFKNTDEKSLGK